MHATVLPPFLACLNVGLGWRLRWVGYFFFFQAEDGIRDHCVTGVQTCALPIYAISTGAAKPARHWTLPDAGVDGFAAPVDIAWQPMLTDTSRVAISPPDALPAYLKPFGAPAKTSRMLRYRASHRRKQFVHCLSRRPFGTKTRSSPSKKNCTSNASKAAGIAPCKIVL